MYWSGSTEEYVSFERSWSGLRKMCVPGRCKRLWHSRYSRSEDCLWGLLRPIWGMPRVGQNGNSTATSPAHAATFVGHRVRISPDVEDIDRVAALYLLTVAFTELMTDNAGSFSIRAAKPSQEATRPEFPIA